MHANQGEQGAPAAEDEASAFSSPDDDALFGEATNGMSDGGVHEEGQADANGEGSTASVAPENSILDNVEEEAPGPRPSGGGAGEDDEPSSSGKDATTAPPSKGKEQQEQQQQQQAFALQKPLLPRPLYLMSVEAASEKELESTIVMCVNKGLANAVLLMDGPISTKEMMINASRMNTICKELEVPLIVESRVTVAAAVGAEGTLVADNVQNLSLYAVRKFMEAASTVVGESTGAAPQMRSRRFQGKYVTSLERALFAQSEMADFIILDVDKTSLVDGIMSKQRAIEKLTAIRKEVSMPLLVTHAFCLRAGGPKAVLSTGADGWVIPSQEVARIVQQQGMESVFGETQQLPKAGRLLGAILLIAGGTVGAGIIALPVKTMPMGFLPSTLALTGCWAFMTVTALLLVELSLWYGPTSNLPKMAENTLGKAGKWTVTALYLFIYCATLTAYIAESSNLLPAVASLFAGGRQVAMATWSAAAAFTTFMSAFIFAGTEQVDKLNSACMLGALVSYFALLSMAGARVQPALLWRSAWDKSLSCLPIMVVAFTFHNIVPSLLSYLGSAKLVSRAVVLGSMLPLGLYVVWQFAILGTIPLAATALTASDIVFGIRSAAGPWATVAVQVFSFFAFVTSFLGVGLGCVDFVADLLGLNRGDPAPAAAGADAGAPRTAPQNVAALALRRMIPLVLTMLPPFVIALSCPSIFLSALEFSGTFRLILFAILPAMMVWRGRYRDDERVWLPGGKLLLLTIMGVAAGVISSEWFAMIAKRLL